VNRLDAEPDLTSQRELAAIGAQLRATGLTPRALAAWAGTARISALPAQLDAAPPAAATPAAAILALLVAGAEVACERLRAPPGLIDALISHALVERDGDRLRARVAIVPHGPGLLVCGRLDAAIERDLVCWPDDSSHHLAAAIPPGRRARWLDLGCGSAFAPLARPELARQIAGVDINPRAVRHARLGAALSGISHLVAALGDVAGPHGGADLVTCNAPMPDPGPGARAEPPHTGVVERALPEVWRRADPGFFVRLWPALARAVLPGGLIVVHGACSAVLPALTAAAGERVVVSYTPDDVPGFAVAWWRPDAPTRLATVRRALTPGRPHVDTGDRDAALGDPPGCGSVGGAGA